jgi:hypothetical protein
MVDRPRPHDDAHDPDSLAAPVTVAAIERENALTRIRLAETLDAIEGRLSPSYLMEQAMAYLRDEASEWGAEVGAFVRRNPLPMAVLGVGLGWLAFTLLRGDRERGDSLADYDAGPEGIYGPAYDDAGEPGDHSASFDTAVRRAARTATARIGREREDIADRAAKVGDRFGRYARDARHRLDDIAEDTRDFADDARDRLSDFASDTIDRASHIGDYARSGAERLQREVVRAADERPMLLGAIGLGIGAAIALCLPGTRMESRLVGARRDELLDELREAGRERLHGAADAVRHAGDAAQARAEKEGLSRRGVSETLDKAQRVAETAIDTATNEAKANVIDNGTKNGKTKGDTESGPAAAKT